MFHVLYLQRGADFSLGLTLGAENPNENELHNFYKVVRKFKDNPKKTDIPEFLEKIFMEMQGENWSPNGAQREFIESVGLSHTSMSTSDAVFDDKRNELWLCKGIGFEKIHVMDLATNDQMDGEALKRILPLNDVHEKVREVYIDQPPLTVMEQFLADADASDWAF